MRDLPIYFIKDGIVYKNMETSFLKFDPSTDTLVHSDQLEDLPIDYDVELTWDEWMEEVDHLIELMGNEC